MLISSRKGVAFNFNQGLEELEGRTYLPLVFHPKARHAGLASYKHGLASQW